jgi:predicted branched-subunit amino acid permease
MRNEARRGSEGYLAGVRAGVPFALVAGVVAISFGVLARSLGWGVLAPLVFSVITFSVAATVIAAALSAVLVPIAPPGVPVLAACGAALLGLKERSS